MKQAEAATGGVLNRKMFLKNWQNSQENYCVDFLVGVSVLETLLKKRLRHRCFPLLFATVLRTPFFTEHLRTTHSEQAQIHRYSYLTESVLTIFPKKSRGSTKVKFRNGNTEIADLKMFGGLIYNISRKVYSSNFTLTRFRVYKGCTISPASFFFNLHIHTCLLST